MSVVLELFAGAGGSSEGLRILSLDSIGIELDPVAADTAMAAGHRRTVTDVAALPSRDFVNITGLWASPPCSSFSASGAGAGRRVMHVLADGITRTARSERVMGRVRRDCARILKAHALTDRKLTRLPRAQRTAWAQRQARVSALVVEVARYFHVLRPEWVACEQVPGVLPLWRVLCAALRRLGYRAWCGIVCAADVGVPQTRRRAILVASRNPAHHVGPPEATHTEAPGDGDLFGPPLPRWRSMADALGWGVADQPSPVVMTARGRQAGPEDVLRGSSWRAAWWKRQIAEGDWVAVRPATTVQADARIAPPGHRDREGGERQFPEATVRVSVAEAACLQSFRADYPWQGTKTARFSAVGNAVPPPLTAAVVGHLLGIDWQPLVADYLTRTVLNTSETGRSP